MNLQGSTNEFPLDVLLRLLADTKKTGELSIRGATGSGALGLAEGQVVTAVFEQEKPIPALGAIFALGEASFEFTPWSDAPTANLEGSLADNLRRAEEHAKWLASVREVIPHDGIRFRLSARAADQGAVTFTPDRWRVVMAVNTQPNVDQLAANLHIDRDEALTTLAGLVRDGVLDTIDAPAPEQPAAPPAPGPPQAAEDSAPAPSTPSTAPTFPAEDWSAALLKEIETTPPAPPPAAPPAETAAAADPWAAILPPTPRQAAPEPESPAPVPQDWSQMMTTRESQPTQEAPSPEPPMPDWGTPPIVEPAPAINDRLGALESLFGAPAAPSVPAPAEPAPAAADAWTAPAADSWSTPAPAATDAWTAPSAAPAEAAPATDTPAAAEEDPRLAAMRLTPADGPSISSAATEAPAQAAQVAPPNEWAPPSGAEAISAPPAPKKGLFGGLFKRDDAASESATRTAPDDRRASSRAGVLAAFANALLTEYKSGHYGKGRVEDRMAGLLMRVDEQADPIDRPLPIVDERLDVQALERVGMPEQQAVPYLALLVSTIYGDAEKAFGRDKAKRGYKAAQQSFGGDMSALSGPDLAGKLPKV